MGSLRFLMEGGCVAHTFHNEVKPEQCLRASTTGGLLLVLLPGPLPRPSFMWSQRGRQALQGSLVCVQGIHMEQLCQTSWMQVEGLFLEPLFIDVLSVLAYAESG